MGVMSVTAVVVKQTTSMFGSSLTYCLAGLKFEV